MRYFPLFVDLKNARAVVVGGGEEALRKVRLLLKTEARIEIIAPKLHPVLAANSRLAWVSDVFLGDMLDGVALVISSDPALNEIVSGEARARGIPVNAVDQADLSTFIVPSIVDRDPVIVAIGTEGAAPVLAQHLRARIDALLPSQLGRLARKAAGLRDLVAARLAQGKARRGFWFDFFFGAAAEAAGDPVAFELAVGDALFTHAHEGAGRLTIIAMPKDIDELTLKGQRRLMEADVIAASSIAAPFLEMARRDAVRIGDTGAVASHVAAGLNVVVLSDDALASMRSAQSLGLTAELIGQPLPRSPNLRIVA